MFRRRRLFRLARVLVPATAALMIALAAVHIRPARDAASVPINGPLRVNSINGRYFTDTSGSAIYLAGSHTWHNLQNASEPEGAFNYNGFLDWLQAHNHNFFRLWAWEQAKWRASDQEPVTFHPLPYNRSPTCCALDGGNKFDLQSFNQSYFDRLRGRVQAARDRGIYVSVMLFQGWSIGPKSDRPGNPWPGHPFNATNNINGINGDSENQGNGYATHNLQIPAITTVQDAYIRKVIDSVGDVDNVLYEVSNEDDVAQQPNNARWQEHVVKLVHQYEARRQDEGGYQRHPIGVTANGTDLLTSSGSADWVSPQSSYFSANNPPAASGSKVVISDTDHIYGTGGDSDYVWRMFTRGNNVLYMDDYANPTCCGLKEGARVAIGETLSYARRIDLNHDVPHGELATGRYALANPGKEYLVFQQGGGRFSVDLRASSATFSVEWMNPATNSTRPDGTVEGGAWRAFSAPFGGSSVLFLRSVGP